MGHVPFLRRAGSRFNRSQEIGNLTEYVGCLIVAVRVPILNQYSHGITWLLHWAVPDKPLVVSGTAFHCYLGRTGFTCKSPYAIFNESPVPSSTTSFIHPSRMEEVSREIPFPDVRSCKGSVSCDNCPLAYRICCKIRGWVFTRHEAALPSHWRLAAGIRRHPFGLCLSGL